ncbi:MAG: TonB-dependent receptor, partial [Desulfobacterales bacterium]|nr:TonB-dependent receptor [Desulfobacterales bacterium]
MRSALLGIGVVFALVSGLFAGTTGKIAGLVQDGSTGNPLPGVNILLEGTTLGAATDADGQYFVISVPPGNYTVVASFIGYATENVTGVRVHIDRTTHLDFGLEVSAIAGEEVVVTAEREAIRLDVSYSQQALTAVEVMATPTGQDLREAIAMGVGIERDLYGHLSIRGGEMDEVGFFVDDFSMSDKRIGIPVIQVPKAAIQEIQILTGGFNAEYGEARSGMINIVTKEGGQNFHGSFDYRLSPKGLKHFGPNVFDPEDWWQVGRYLFMEANETGDSTANWRGEKVAVWEDENGNNIDHDFNGEPDFQGWKAYYEDEKDEEGLVEVHSSPKPDYADSPEELLAFWKYQTRKLDYGHEPDHYAEYTLGGPLPLMGGKLTFFLSGYYDKTMYQFRLSRPAFVDHNQSIKLNYQLSDNLSLALRGGYGETLSSTYDAEPQRFINPHYFDNVAKAMDGLANAHLYNADSRMVETAIQRNTFGFDVRHMLNPSSFYDLKFHYDRVKYNSAPGRWRDSTVVYTTPGGIELDESPVGFCADKWKDQLAWHRLGEDKGYRDYSWYETYRLRADYTNQVTLNHQLKAGFGGTSNIMYLDYGRDRWQSPYPEPDKRWENWTKRTVGYLESYAYAQDKIEFEGMIVNVGLRADVFGSQEPVFTDPWSDYYKSTKVTSIADSTKTVSINYDSLYYAPTEDPKLK